MPEIKITLKEMREAQPAMQKLLNTETNFKLAYRLNRLTKKLMSEYENIENARIDLIKKFGEKTPEGNLRVLPEKNEEFASAFNELIKTEITLEIDLIPQELMTDIKLSAVDLVNIEKFIQMEGTTSHT